MQLPPAIESEAAREELLTRPSPALVEMMARLPGDLTILGAGGKMGPSLSILAKRAAREAGVEKRIYAVSRFSDTASREQLTRAGVDVISCDLLDPAQIAALPKTANMVFMAGRKFGETGSEAMTWMVNVVAPALAARHYQGARTVVFSTGCVYRLEGAASGGSREIDTPEPVGEYATSSLGRERVFAWHAEKFQSPTLLFRLNYAVDLHYGILVDIARQIAKGAPVDLSVNHFNCIWQGDANERALLSLDHARFPAIPLNVTGAEMLRVDETAHRLAKLMNRPVHFVGTDRDRAYLSNAAASLELFGPPRVDTDTLLSWVADWVVRGGKLHDKPTLFQVTDGDFSRKVDAK